MKIKPISEPKTVFKRGLVVTVALNLCLPQQSQSHQLLTTTTSLIDWYKNARVVPVIWGYYWIDDFHINVGIRIKI